jgi:uncharacterized membrane protein YdbT with pleckstrin-like domain
MQTSSDPYASPATITVDSAVIWASSEGQVDNLGYFAACIALCWLLVPLLALLWRYWSTASHEYELTLERLQERRGVISRRTDELELYRVKDLSITEPFLQRLFGRGRVVLQTSDRSTPIVVLNCIPDPHYVAFIIREHVERCRVMKGVREID